MMMIYGCVTSAFEIVAVYTTYFFFNFWVVWNYVNKIDRIIIVQTDVLTKYMCFVNDTDQKF